MRFLKAAEPAVLVYRTDLDYKAAHPEVDFPASWHRAVVARIALEVPGLAIAYAPSGKIAGGIAVTVGKGGVRVDHTARGRWVRHAIDHEGVPAAGTRPGRVRTGR